VSGVKMRRGGSTLGGLDRGLVDDGRASVPAFGVMAATRPGRRTSTSYRLGT
jgi:hypothetical protein